MLHVGLGAGQSTQLALGKLEISAFENIGNAVNTTANVIIRA